MRLALLRVRPWDWRSCARSEVMAVAKMASEGLLGGLLGAFWGLLEASWGPGGGLGGPLREEGSNC